jgi:hypothetical protein
MNNELPVEIEWVKLTARVNELEHQVEVMKDAIRWLIFTGDVYDYDKIAELKVLVNPNLFPDDEVIDVDGD